ncbi:MAG: hypothetical protein MK137_07310 [Rickettsiales bacterium]|nr:hypothetical protein [Rickettsiales bacterium]
MIGLEDTIEAARARGHLYRLNKKYQSVQNLTGAGYFDGLDQQEEQQAPQQTR